MVKIETEVLMDDTKKTQKKSMPQCWVCMNKGFILYDKKVGEYTYEHIAHCTCEKGKQFVYTGQANFIPCVDMLVDPEILIQENQEKFKRGNQD